MSSGKDSITYRIRELDPDMIAPSTKNMDRPEQGGSKIVIIGKPGTGKTTLITSLLYEKSHIFPAGIAMSGTEDSNGHYSKIFPSTFVFNAFDKPVVDQFINRQKLAKQHLPNPWAILLLDDCTDDPKIFNDPMFLGLYKNGRHWKMFFILSLQYSLDIKPAIRTNIDGTFILRETNLRNRRMQRQARISKTACFGTKPSPCLITFVLAATIIGRFTTNALTKNRCYRGDLKTNYT
jgi:GTPase SAR1 family protein